LTQNTSPLKISIGFGEAEGASVVRDRVLLADKLGFHGVWIADHFMPWFHSGKNSPFVWSLIASCLESTKNIKIGPCVTTPIGGRDHPALIAQASATIENMYPGRFRLSVGTGEAVNEARFSMGWPSLKERTERLVEGLDLIKELWASDEFVKHDGKYFPMNDVFLYTKPKQPPPIYFSCLGPKSAYLAGELGYDLLTLIVNGSDVGVTVQRCGDVIIPKFVAGVKSAGSDPKSKQKVVGLSLSFDSKEKFLSNARNSAGYYARGALDEPDPREMATRKSGSVTDEDLLKEYVYCSSWDDAIDVTKKIEEMGATEVFFWTGTDPDLITKYAEKILRYFTS